MKHHIINIKNSKLFAIPWLFLVLIFFSLSVTVAFSVIPQSLAAQTTMEVYQQAGRKAFGQETSLDIFNDPKSGGQKLLHPSSSGAYTFAVYNNSSSDLLPYSLSLLSANPGGIPLVFSLQKNGNYIYGGEDAAGMVPLSEIHFPENDLDGSKTDLYTLNWAWKSESDAVDAALGNDGTQLYKLTITATGTIPEVKDLPSPAPPQTGIVLPMLIWFVIMVAAVMLILFLLFWKRRKEDDEDPEAVSENA